MKQIISILVWAICILFNVDTKGQTYTNSSATTPNGSTVAALYCSVDLSTNDKNYKNSLAQSTFPNATFLSGSTAKYNCHSYAWYSQSTSTNKWINNPTLYWSDGSYTLRSAWLGNKVRYATDATYHSAIVYPTNQCGQVRSKWGNGPLMQHMYNYCPYTNNSNLRFYKLAGTSPNIRMGNQDEETLSFAPIRNEEGLVLEQNVPNPFVGQTTIAYQIPKDGQVELLVFEAETGRQVAILVNETQNAGQYQVNLESNNLSSGMYIVELKMNGLRESVKILLTK